MQDASYLLRLPKADIAFLIDGYMDEVPPTLFELELYEVSGKDGHYYCCAFSGCPVTSTAAQMVNIRRFVFCRSHGIEMKRLAEGLYGPQKFSFFPLAVTVANVTGSESDERVRQAKEWLAGEPARLAAYKAKRSSRVPGPAVELAAAKMADPAADLPVPTAAPASSVAPTLSTGASVSVETAGNHNSDEMDKLDEQLEALEKLKDILAQEAIDAAKQVIATRMQSLNRRAIAVLQGKLVALETVDGELSLEVFQETKQKILDKLSALGVTDATAPVQTSVAPDSVALQPSAKLEPPVATTPAPAPNGRKSDHDNTASSVLDIVGRLAAGKHHGIQFGDRRGNGAVAEYQCVVAKNAPQACSTWASADRMRAVVMRGGRVFFGICNICSAIAEAANIPVGQMTFQQMLQLKNSEPVQGIDVEPMLRLGPGGKPVRKTGKTEKKRAKRVCVAPVDKSGDQFPKPQKKLTKEERAAAKRAAQGK